MSVTFEDALSTLEAMFPQWDRETLALMLQENSNHVERTIEAIFRMEGGGDDIGSSANNRSYSGGSEDYSSPVYASSMRPSSNESLRGTLCRLPSDFLKPPQGWKVSNETFGDQQLALMLQNEMFQREVESTLGPDFFNRQRQSRSGGPQSPTSRQGADTSSNLGILKGLHNMGDAAKRNLSALAHQFARNKAHSDSADRSKLINDEEAFTHNPFRHDDRRGDDEVIDFVNPASRSDANRDRHVDTESPSKSRSTMRSERGMFSDRGTSSVSAQDILSPKTPQQP